jgi:cysteine synthase
MLAAGATLHLVEEPDRHGGYLLSRMRAVRRMCRGHPDYRWANQYGSPANPLVHERTTGPEIVAQGGPELETVYVAVSTGGTLAGISAHIRRLTQPIRMVAVDASYSHATGLREDRPGISPPREPGWAVDYGAGPRPQGRLVPGIGASRPSTFLEPGCYDQAIAVPDAAAVAMCQMFREDTGLALGGSSGSVLTGCVEDLSGPRPPHLGLCVAADSGANYASTVYDDDWQVSVGIYGAVKRAVDRCRGNGLRFGLGS